MRSDITPGAVFPDYELSDHTGKHRKLSELVVNEWLHLFQLDVNERAIYERRAGRWKKRG